MYSEQYTRRLSTMLVRSQIWWPRNVMIGYKMKMVQPWHNGTTHTRLWITEMGTLGIMEQNGVTHPHTHSRIYRFTYGGRTGYIMQVKWGTYSLNPDNIKRASVG